MKTIIEKKVEDAVDKTFMEKREKIEKYYKEKYPNDFKSKFKKLYDMEYTSLQKEFNRLKNQLEESNVKGNKMKKSELTEFIKEEITSVLSESTEEEVEKTKELTAATKELAKAKEEAGISEDTVSEGTWSSGTYNEIGRFIQDVKNLKDKYYNIVGNDDVFDGLDRAELSAREMMIDAPENRSDLNEDDMGAPKYASELLANKSEFDTVVDELAQKIIDQGSWDDHDPEKEFSPKKEDFLHPSYIAPKAPPQTEDEIAKMFGVGVEAVRSEEADSMFPYNHFIVTGDSQKIKSIARSKGIKAKDAGNGKVKIFGKIQADDANAYSMLVFGVEKKVRELKKSKGLAEARKKSKNAADVEKEVKAKESEMKEKAKEYKSAEGKAKEKIKGELKKMTTEKNDLKKKLEALKKKEEEKIANTGKNQTLDTSELEEVQSKKK